MAIPASENISSNIPANTPPSATNGTIERVTAAVCNFFYNLGVYFEQNFSYLLVGIASIGIALVCTSHILIGSVLIAISTVCLLY